MSKCQFTYARNNKCGRLAGKKGLCCYHEKAISDRISVSRYYNVNKDWEKAYKKRLKKEARVDE